ncbi:hypothetical protein ACJX0J_022741 [Zea mays]
MSDQLFSLPVISFLFLVFHVTFNDLTLFSATFLYRRNVINIVGHGSLSDVETQNLKFAFTNCEQNENTQFNMMLGKYSIMMLDLITGAYVGACFIMQIKALSLIWDLKCCLVWTTALIYVNRTRIVTVPLHAILPGTRVAVFDMQFSAEQITITIITGIAGFNFAPLYMMKILAGNATAFLDTIRSNPTII